MLLYFLIGPALLCTAACCLLMQPIYVQCFLGDIAFARRRPVELVVVAKEVIGSGGCGCVAEAELAPGSKAIAGLPKNFVLKASRLGSITALDFCKLPASTEAARKEILGATLLSGHRHAHKIYGGGLAVARAEPCAALLQPDEPAYGLYSSTTPSSIPASSSAGGSGCSSSRGPRRANPLAGGSGLL
jgi:hypothetical protein